MGVEVTPFFYSHYISKVEPEDLGIYFTLIFVYLEYIYMYIFIYISWEVYSYSNISPTPNVHHTATFYIHIYPIFVSNLYLTQPNHEIYSR